MMHEFWNRSAYSQPTNLAAFAAGTVATVMLGPGALLIVGIGAGFLAGLAVQGTFAEFGLDKEIGDLLTK